MKMQTKAADFRRREQRQIIRQRIRFEKSFYKPIRQALNKQVQPVIDSLERGQSIELVSADTINELPIVELFLRMYPAVGVPFARQAYGTFKHLYVPDYRTKQDEVSSIETSWIERFRQYALTVGAEKIRGITDTTKEFVRGIIAKAGKQGLSIPDTAELLRREWQQLTSYRAIVIARTEVLSISNHAQYIGSKDVAQQVGLQLDKVWLATSDSRTRDTHRTANGQRVGIDELFTVGGYHAMYPGDSERLPVKELIQCRCSHFYEPK